MKKKNIFLWVLLFIFLTTYNFNLEKGPIDSFFHIKKVEVNGIKNGNIDEIQDRLKIFNEENIITVDQKKIITNYVAAISVGIVDNKPCLDLEYEEDSVAQVDANFVICDN